MQCPSCGSVELRTSRDRGAGDAALRLFGIAPRRCPACGWRGHRPRFFSGLDRRARSSALGTGQGADLAGCEERERALRRQRRRRSHALRRTSRALRAVLFALALGAGTGLVAYALSGE